MTVLSEDEQAEKTVKNTGEKSKLGMALRILGTLLSLGLLVYLIYATGWDEFSDNLKRIPPSYFLITIVLIFVSRIFTTLRWLTLLRFAKTKVSFWQAFRLMFMGNFASNFLPSTIGGDIVRMAGMVGLGEDAGVSAASLVVDRLTGMAGMSSFAPFGLWMISGQAGGAGFSPASLGWMGIITGLRRIPGVGWVIKKLEKFTRSLISSSMSWLRRPLSLVLALLCTYGHMLMIFLLVWVLLKGMGQSMSIFWIGALWSLSYFISLLPVSVNGIGLQEVSISTLYSQFGGVSMESALALAVLYRLLQLIASLPGALFLPEILRPLYGLDFSRKNVKATPHQD